MRVGSTNRRADRELAEELGRFVRGEAYDEQPMPELNSEALDFRAASESFAPTSRACGWSRRARGGACRRSVGCSSSAESARNTSPTHGARPAASAAPTRAASPDCVEIHSFPVPAVEGGRSRAAKGTAACDSSHFVDELGKAVEQVRRVFGEIGGNAPFVDAGVEKARDVGSILWAIGG